MLSAPEGTSMWVGTAYCEDVDCEVNVRIMRTQKSETGYSDWEVVDVDWRGVPDSDVDNVWNFIEQMNLEDYEGLELEGGDM